MSFKNVILYAVCIGLFLGLMVPGMGGLLYPPMLENVGGPFITSKTDRITLGTEDYSYKPGESGTAYTYSLVTQNGDKTDVTFKLLWYCFLVYSAIFIVLSFIVLAAISKLIARSKETRLP